MKLYRIHTQTHPPSVSTCTTLIHGVISHIDNKQAQPTNKKLYLAINKYFMSNGSSERG